jgi:hypothetical protein
MVIVRAVLLGNTHPDAQWTATLTEQLRTVTVEVHPASAAEVYLVLAPAEQAHPAAADQAAAQLIACPSHFGLLVAAHTYDLSDRD